MPTGYVIEGGQPGRDRLRLLSAALEPTTARLLDRAGVGPGMRCLDVGCGGGDVTRELARRVGPRGSVVGLDFDEKVLALAREDAVAEGLSNITFRAGDALSIPDGAAFDVVYARFLLTHLPDWRGGLRRLIQSAKPGGIVVVEDIDFSGHFCHPESEAVRRYVTLYQATVTHHGGDPLIGPKLPSAMMELGLESVAVEVIQPAFLSGEGKRLAAVTLERIAPRVVEAGLATAEEVAKVIADLEAYARDPRTLLSLTRVFQVWGRFPSA